MKSKSENDKAMLRPAHETRSPEIIDVTKPFDWRGFAYLLIEKWRLIVLVTLLVTVSAIYITRRIPDKYQARAVLQVEQEEHRLIGVDSVSHQDLRPPEVLNTIVQNVRNSTVLRRVVANNNLVSNPNFFSHEDGLPSENKLVRVLSGMITVKLRPDTRLIDIIVTHRDPVLAERLANSVAEEFIRQNLYDRFSTAKAANGLLYEEALKLKQKLQESEQQLQAYREATRTISIEDREHLIVEKLRDLTSRYTEAQSARLAVQAELEQVKSVGTNAAAILALPSVQADLAVTELRRRLVEQEARVAALTVEYQPGFPRLQQAKEQLLELEKVVHNFADKVRAAVQLSYEAALAREKNLEAALAQSQTEAMDLDKKSVGYNVLLRELQSDRALYDSVLKRLKETDLSKGLGQASISLVEPATQPVTLIRPPVLLLVAGASALGLGSIVALLCLLRAMRGAIQTVDEAEHFLQLPVWAAIPQTVKRKIGRLPHITVEEPASLCSESFRTLRTTASIYRNERDNRVTLFTSADPEEGKTFCSLNFAICQAQEGKRTLLIDMDLRKPSVGQTFDLPHDTPGVADYFAREVPLKELIRETAYPNLFVLCAGTRLSNPSEELAKGSVEDFLDEARFSFDRVVVDTAPVNAVSDTLLILPFVDLVCLVVKSRQTPQRAIKRAIAMMARANVEPSGIVLNYVPQKSGYGYYYSYTPQYGYGSGPYQRSSPRKALLNS